MRTITFFMIAVLTVVFTDLNAQIATFDDLTLPPDSFWNGSDLSGGFYNQDIYFVNYYDTSWGGFWNGGFAYSNMTDTVTAGYGNEYSVMAGHAYSGNNFAVVNPGSFNTTYLRFPTIKKITGFYITNSSYAYISMRDGDNYAKKFGGVSGDDPDWFKLTVYGYADTVFTDSAEFYLADFRFSDNSQDYIIKDWTIFDLSGLGNIDSLVFKLSSSDVGQYGMNTPAFFCMDNLQIDNTGIYAAEKNNTLYIFPNPVTDVVNILLKKNKIISVKLVTMTGKILKQENINSNRCRISLSSLSSGIYYIVAKTGNSVIVKEIVKE